MKKKISIILLMFTMILSSITYVDDVWGIIVSTNVQSVPNGKAQTCSGNNCYSLGTSGVRFMLVDQGGNQVGKIAEYWFYSEEKPDTQFFHTYETEDTAVVYFNKVYMKQQLLEEIKNEKAVKDYAKINALIDVTTTEKPNIDSIEELGDDILVGFNSKFSFFDEKGNIVENSENGIYYCADKDKHEKKLDDVCKYGGSEIKFKTNTRVSNVTETIMKKIVDDAKSTNPKGYLNNLLMQMGLEGGVNDLGENYYLQAEPLVQWNNNRIDSKSCGMLNVTFLGTPTEFTLLKETIVEGALNLEKPTDVQKNNKVRNTKINAANSEYNRCAFNDNNTIRFYELATVGIYTSDLDDMPSGIGLKTTEKLNVYNYMDFSYDTTMGVGFISLKDFGGKCNDNARAILNSVNIKTFNETGKELNINYEEIEKKFKADDKIASECYNAAGELKSNCIQLSEEYLKKVGVVPQKYQNVNLCERPKCESTVVDQINKEFPMKDDKYADGYHEIINYLYENSKEIFNEKQSGLSYSVYSFFNEPATCKRGIPSCPSTGEVFCENNLGNKSFTISDSNESEKCILQNVAYNDKLNEDDDSISLVQSSKDNHYTDKFKLGNIYCHEKVDFNFPNGGQSAVAGTVFKWGINSDKDSNVFGTMTVTRTCYFTEDFRKSNKERVIDSTWVDTDINTTFKLYYEQALGDDNLNIKNKTLEANLGLQLYSFESQALKENGEIALGDFNYIVYNSDGSVNEEAVKQKWSGEKPLVIRWLDSNKTNDSVRYSSLVKGELKGNNPRQFTCNGSNCSTLDRVKMVATYNIVYDENFKWYSDKNLNGELIDLAPGEKLEDHPSYAFAGYGLPTSFVNAKNENCLQWDGVESVDEDKFDKTNGDLKLYVDNVGTKGHFDALIKSDKLFEDEEGNDTKIDYYCDYKVDNPLFDNEYDLAKPYMCDPNRTPKGIDVVFRTIDLISDKDELNKAFPGRSGLGIKEGEVGTRTMGANWYKFSDESIADLLGEDIYSREPMYEITLDSPTIQTIREWNNAARSKNIDPYTDMSSVDNSSNEGNTGYYYSKIDKTVRSMFLTKLYEEFSGNEKFKSRCISTVSDDGGYTRIVNCNQSWWLDDPDERNKISMELRTPIGE